MEGRVFKLPSKIPCNISNTSTIICIIVTNAATIAIAVVGITIITPNSIYWYWVWRRMGSGGGSCRRDIILIIICTNRKTILIILVDININSNGRSSGLYFAWLSQISNEER